MRKFLQFTLSLLAMLMVTLNANAWKFASASPETGEVESLDRIVLNLPADAGWLTEFSATFTLTDQNGNETQCNFSTMSVGIVDTDSSFKGITTPGTYTLTIPAGSLHYMDANWMPTEPNEAQTFTWIIKDSDAGGGEQGGGEQGGGSATSGWSFTSVSPAEGEVESLKSFTFVLPSNLNWLNTGGTGTMTLPDGTIKEVSIYDNFSSINGDILVDDPLTAAGEYTLSIPANAIEGSDGTKNAAMTYTWTIKGEDAPAQKDYTITYDAAAGTVYVTWPQGTTLAATDLSGMMHPTIEGFAGSASGGSFNAPNVIEVWANLAPGDYTLKFPAGDFTVNNVPNAEFSETFTVGGGSQGGGNHEFDGTPYHETIFKASETAVDKNNIGFDTDGVTVTTEGYTTIEYDWKGNGTEKTVKVGYNTYEEKEIDWFYKTKLIFTAKKDVNKIILIPTASGKNAMQYASAEGGDGEYNNGVWEGKLAAGETLTLTSNDGTQIKEIYVCYNGDDFDPTAGSDEKGVITIQYPVENQLIAKLVDGGKFCTFTTNKEYAQVTIEIVNSNPTYDNLDKFPTRMVDNAGENSDGLHVGENTVKAATPASGSAGKGDDWFFFKGDSYKMVVKGFVNMWDVMPDNYDAIAEVNFVGDGKEHVAESIVKLLNVTPATSFDSFGKIAMVNGVITLEFDGPVTSVKAITPGGMSDPTINHTATAKAGSDNKVWEINLGDRSDFASADTDGNPIIEVDVTATAADGIVLLSDTRADRGLELKYELVANAGPTNPVTLGDPTWSVAEGAEIEASTSSINIKFPNATNVEGTYTLEVSGTIGDKNLNLVNVSGTGTMADGADINVSLAENIGYNLFIGTITIKDANGGTVYSTEQGNFQLNFGTKDSSMGGGDNSILGEPTITADAEGITVSWPNADLDGTGADYVAFQEWTISVNGENISFYPDNIDGISDGISVTIPYEKIAVYDPTIGEWGTMVPVELASGDKITITIPEGAIEVDAGWTTVYANESAITVEATVPSNEPAPTSVVLYEKGVNPEVAASVEGDDARDLVIEGTDVTLAISNTSTSSMGKYFNNAYIDNSKGGIITTNTNVMKFTSSRTIEKIEFTANKTISQKTGTSCVGTLADNVWTGEASEISIAIGENVTNISKIVVYFKADSATGINNAASVNVANDKMYNLAGQQIKVAKGIVIKNGKKMFVK